MVRQKKKKIKTRLIMIADDEDDLSQADYGTSGQELVLLLMGINHIMRDFESESANAAKGARALIAAAIMSNLELCQAIEIYKKAHPGAEEKIFQQ